MSTTTTYHALTKPADADFADNAPLNTNFDVIDAAMSDIGDIKMTARSTTPGANYMICDGSAISRTTYATLFTAIGTTYGAGDGSTTFNIPDMRGVFPLGKSATHALGSTGGAETVTLTTTELPAHTHTGPSHSHTIAHTHDLANTLVTNTTATGGANRISAVGSGASPVATTTGSSAANSGSDGTGNTGSTGTGSAFSKMPPFVTINFLIRVL